MKRNNELVIDKNFILKYTVITVILILILKAALFLKDFVSFFLKDVESITYRIQSHSFSYLLSYNEAIDVESYKNYILFNYISRIPLFIFICFMFYKVIDLINSYDGSLFTDKISKKLIKLYYTFLIFSALKYIIVMIDSILFNNTFIFISDRIIYYFDLTLIIPCVIAIIFINLYMLAKEEKTIKKEIKNSIGLFDKLFKIFKQKN